MAHHQFDWEKDLSQPPLLHGGSDIEWMNRVEKKIRTKKPGFSSKVSLAACVIAVIVILGVFVSNDDSLRKWMPMLNDANQASQTPLVEGNGIRILPGDFLLYKEIVYEPGQAGLSNDEILQNMIIQRLTARYAQSLGIEAPSREVDLAIGFERDLLHRKDDPDNDAYRQLLADRIKRSGLSENEYWQSDVLRKINEERQLLSRLMSKLMRDGTMNTQSDLTRLQKGLWMESKDKLTFNWSALWNMQ